MEVERIQQQGVVFYRVHSTFAKDPLTFEREELLVFLHWLKEHEDDLTNGAISNRVQDELQNNTEPIIRLCSYCGQHHPISDDYCPTDPYKPKE